MSALGLFAEAKEVAVVLPSDRAALGPCGSQKLANFAQLLVREQRELEVELGAPVLFVADLGALPRFLIGPSCANPAMANFGALGAAGPGLWFDRSQQTLIADAPDMDGIFEAMNLLRSLRMRDAEMITPSFCKSVDDAASRIVDEVGWSYPSFELHGLDWPAICERHAAQVRVAANPLAAMQTWLAELQDGHTSVRTVPPTLPLPYTLSITAGSAILVRVPKGSSAWEAGARPGDQLQGEDTAGWYARTGAPPHARSLFAGRRLLAGPIGIARTFIARSPAGNLSTWTEAPATALPSSIVSWTRLPSGNGYLRISAWRTDADLDAAVDAAFSELRGASQLIVDLRGNSGGNLNQACAFRDRFLRAKTTLGEIRFSTGDGGLSKPQPLVGEPASTVRCWPGRVRFLTDPLTYSASEDALLGLQGLPHVQVLGEPSGGGSGRMRSINLMRGQVLNVSTALTFDRVGRCIEGRGIQVDRLIKSDPHGLDAGDVALETADSSW